MKMMHCGGGSRILLTWVLLLLLWGTCGCEQKKMTDPKGTLETVAAEYWNKRLIEKDYKAIYQMEQEKGTLPYEEYLKHVRNAGRIGYISIIIKDAKVDGNKGTVSLVIKGKVAPNPVAISSLLSDNWVIHESQWKHVLKKRGKL